VRGVRDRPGAEHEDQRAERRVAEQISRQVCDVFDVCDVTAESAERRADRRRVDAGQRRLGSRIDPRQHDPVGAAEREGEVAGEVARAGVAVRLKRHDQRSLPIRASGRDRRIHRGRVVSVVVDDRHARHARDDLEPASNAAVAPEPVRDRRERNAQLARDRDRR
jgi:hypothetical protein